VGLTSLLHRWLQTVTEYRHEQIFSDQCSTGRNSRRNLEIHGLMLNTLLLLPDITEKLSVIGINGHVGVKI